MSPWSSMVHGLFSCKGSFASGSSSMDSLGKRFQEAWTASSETNLGLDMLAPRGSEIRSIHALLCYSLLVLSKLLLPASNSFVANVYLPAYEFNTA